MPIRIFANVTELSDCIFIDVNHDFKTLTPDLRNSMVRSLIRGYIPSKPSCLNCSCKVTIWIRLPEQSGLRKLSLNKYPSNMDFDVFLCLQWEDTIWRNLLNGKVFMKFCYWFSVVNAYFHWNIFIGGPWTGRLRSGSVFGSSFLCLIKNEWNRENVNESTLYSKAYMVRVNQGKKSCWSLSNI